MFKKLLLIFVLVLCVGCVQDKEVVIKKASGDSLTYNFFKYFDSSKYLVYFLDRNSSSNDNTKIVFGRDGDKYYYEIIGDNSQKIIQIDGYRYTVSDSGYFKEESEVVDYSKGILPDNISSLKTMGYTTGSERVFNKKYIYEKYGDDKENTVYYYNGDKLVYVRYSGILNEVLLRFDHFEKVSSKIFEIDDSLVEISY